MNESSDQNFGTGVPPARKNNWKLVLGFIAALGIIGLVLSMVYGERPKKFEVMAKRKHPPVRSVYALVLSPLDSMQTATVVDSVWSDIGRPDSSDINMIVAGTALYKRFVSADECRRVLQQALREAHTADINTQSVLISQLTGILINDTMPTTLYLFGKLASENFDVVKKQLNTSARIIVQRNSIFGPVRIVSYLSADHNDALTRFLTYFDTQGIPVVRRELVHTP